MKKSMGEGGGGATTLNETTLNETTLNLMAQSIMTMNVIVTLGTIKL
jgi:hypothetical protein